MEVRPFYDGLARVLIEFQPMSSRGFGFIDRTSQVVISPFQHSGIRSLEFT